MAARLLQGFARRDRHAAPAAAHAGDLKNLHLETRV
jgi:hypothetical protein